MVNPRIPKTTNLDASPRIANANDYQFYGALPGYRTIGLTVRLVELIEGFEVEIKV